MFKYRIWNCNSECHYPHGKYYCHYDVNLLRGVDYVYRNTDQWRNVAFLPVANKWSKRGDKFSDIYFQLSFKQ